MDKIDNKVLYNKLLENIILPLGDAFMGASFMKHLRELRKEVLLSDVALEKLQLKRLSEILQFATEYSPYYKKLNIDPAKDPISWLANFPVLDKVKLRDAGLDMLTRPLEGLIKNGSSGSTGFQSIVYWSREEQSRFRASQILFWEWGGYKLGDPIVQTGINPKRTTEKIVKDKLLRTKYIQAFSHDEKEIAALLRSLPKGKYGIMGYSSSLFVFAEIAKKFGILDQEFTTAVTWGDKVFNYYRSTVSNAFSCKVYETYGSAEGFLMAGQKDLDYMYWMSPNVYLELVDDFGNPVPDGTLGHVLVTNLIAKTQPMIRYRIGDLAIRLPKENYPANRDLALPLLQKVIGRDTDIVRTPNGKSLVVHSFTGLFEHIPEISQFKVIQRSVQGIEIEYIPGAGFSVALLEVVREKLNSLINDSNFIIELKEVAHIGNTASGKPQLIESHIKVTL